MRVEVRLYATLRKYGPGNNQVLMLDLPDGAGVAEVLQALSIPADEQIVLSVNGRPAKGEDSLKEGDRVVMFPPVTGG